MSSDNANTTNKLKKIIDNFENKNIDILIATQIMAKGYHFPNLSLVGVIDADAGLMGGDLRAMEGDLRVMEGGLKVMEGILRVMEGYLRVSS